ncbi:hypothetical protein Tco_0054538 [Tanacetum coccineum]
MDDPKLLWKSISALRRKMLVVMVRCITEKLLRMVESDMALPLEIRGISTLGISSEWDFLGTTTSYTAIKDLMLRLCHRLIACSIAGRSQAPKKVTVTDLFYLRGMDVESVNIPYLMAWYLRRFSSRRKRGALISGGQFVARLYEHFGLLTEERLQGLTVIVRYLQVIDMAELVRLQI